MLGPMQPILNSTRNGRIQVIVLLESFNMRNAIGYILAAGLDLGISPSATIPPYPRFDPHHLRNAGPLTPHFKPKNGQ